jgi:chromosome segregation ATPase
LFLCSRVEKERNSVAQELEENQIQLQQDQVDKSSLEKNGKMVAHGIGDMKSRLDEIQRALHEADGAKRKLVVENCDLTHHAEEAERSAATLSKDKTSLATQLEDARRLADAETRVGRHG